MNICELALRTTCAVHDCACAEWADETECVTRSRLRKKKGVVSRKRPEKERAAGGSEASKSS